MDAKRHLKARADYFELLRHFVRGISPGLPRAEVRRFVGAMQGLKTDVDAALKRLLDENVLVADEGDELSLHPHVEKDTRWLLQHQRVDTPRVLQARISAMEEHIGDLADAAKTGKVELAISACGECDQILREMQEWSSDSRRAVVADVMSMKAREDRRTAQQRLQAILNLHDRYVVPLRAIVKAQGEMPAAIVMLETTVRASRAAFGRDPSMGTRLDLVLARALSLERQVLDDFIGASTEVLPLYQEARRDSTLTQAAAHCLDSIMRDGIDALDLEKHLASPTFRVDGIFGLPDLKEVMEAAGRKQQPIPRIRIPKATASVRQSVPRQRAVEELKAAAPVGDLLGWLFDHYPSHPEEAILMLYSELLDAREFERGKFAASATARSVGVVEYRYHPVGVNRVAS